MESDIKKIIKGKGFTLEQVAAQMSGKDGKGISQSALTQMLNGNPSISRIKEIAKIVGVSVSELIGDELIQKKDEENEVTEITCPHCGKPIFLEVSKS